MLVENKKKILIVIDVQNDFVTGSLGTPEAQAVVPNIVKKVEEYRSRDDVIIFTTDTQKTSSVTLYCRNFWL